MTIRILNLYAGIGGNRKFWDGDIEVTAVENNEEIAKIYQDFFPKDTVIVADAHQYLLEHYKEFDFIWSSPPCPSHSKFRFMTTKMTNPKYSRQIIYPDMSLYQEIVFLKHYFKGKWVVENVNPYYEPLIVPIKLGRHCFWSNFNISNIEVKKDNLIKKHASELKDVNGFNISKISSNIKDLVLRNCVNSELGLHIFRCAFKNKQEILL